jgi:hypothetical protein
LYGLSPAILQILVSTPARIDDCIASNATSSSAVSTAGDDPDSGFGVGPEYMQSKAHYGDADADIHHSGIEAGAQGIPNEDENHLRADKLSDELKIPKHKPDRNAWGRKGSRAALTRSEKVGKDTYQEINVSLTSWQHRSDHVFFSFVAAQPGKSRLRSLQRYRLAVG